MTAPPHRTPRPGAVPDLVARHERPLGLGWTCSVLSLVQCSKPKGFTTSPGEVRLGRPEMAPPGWARGETEPVSDANVGDGTRSPFHQGRLTMSVVYSSRSSFLGIKQGSLVLTHTQVSETKGSRGNRTFGGFPEDSRLQRLQKPGKCTRSSRIET